MATFDISSLVTKIQQDNQLKMFEQYVGMEIIEAINTGNDLLIEYTIRKYEFMVYADSRGNNIDINTNMVAREFLETIRSNLFQEEFKNSENKEELLYSAVKHLSKAYNHDLHYERKYRETGEQTNFISSHMRRLLIELTAEGKLTAEELGSLDKNVIRYTFKLLENPTFELRFSVPFEPQVQFLNTGEQTKSTVVAQEVLPNRL